MTHKAVSILRIFGLTIKLDASWLLITPLIVWSLATGYFPVVSPNAQTSTHFSMAVVATLGLFGSLILHELAHAVVTRRFGQKYPGVTLFLFGGVAEIQTNPAKAKSDVWIAVAGPVASLCLALACAVDAVLAHLANLPDPVIQVLASLALLNLAVALLNLLPAFPADGGRVVRAWLWARSGDLLVATRRISTVSAAFAYTLIAIGLWAGFIGNVLVGLWPIVIGLFLLSTSRAALAQLETKAALDGKPVADLMTRNPRTASPDQTLSQLVNQIFLGQETSFVPILENGVLLGYVDMPIVGKIDREHWTTTTVEDVIETASDQNTVTADMAGFDLILMIIRTGRRKFLVTDKGRLVGVVTLSDVVPMLRTFVDAAVRTSQGIGIRE